MGLLSAQDGGADAAPEEDDAVLLQAPYSPATSPGAHSNGYSGPIYADRPGTDNATLGAAAARTPVNAMYTPRPAQRFGTQEEAQQARRASGDLVPGAKVALPVLQGDEDINFESWHNDLSSRLDQALYKLTPPRS